MTNLLPDFTNPAIMRERVPSIATIHEALSHQIRTHGSPDLSGVEEEVLTLKRNGAPAPYEEAEGTESPYIRFWSEIVEMADGQKAYARHVDGTRDIMIGGETPTGSYNVETSTLTTEFAHAPSTSAWDVYRNSMANRDRMGKAAARNGLIVAGVSLPPSIVFEDIRFTGAVIPYSGYSYSYTNLTNGVRECVSVTSFGNTSVHNNQGFNDPDLMARYARVALTLTPTIVAITANSPLWNNKQAKDAAGRPLLSLRCHNNLRYEEIFGRTDLSIAYPEFLLRREITFADVVEGFLDQPLDRTIVDGKKIMVGDLTMRQYIEKGWRDEQGHVHFPAWDAIQMMLREPMTDLRFAVFSGPRVETRSHEAGPYFWAAAVNALHLGLLANLDEAEKLADIYGSVETIRSQRREVCYTALKTPFRPALDKTISTQQDMANRLLEVAHAGLRKRGLGEEKLLAPFMEIVETGKTMAERQLEVFENVCDSNLRRTRNMDNFLRYCGYACDDLFGEGRFSARPLPRKQVSHAPVAPEWSRSARA